MIDIRSFRDVLRLFFIFKREFKIAMTITIIVALLGAFLLPLKFASESRLLVKNGRENSIMSIDAGNRQQLIAPTTVRDPIIDEEKMLTRPHIIKQVAQQYLILMENTPAPEGFLKKLKLRIKTFLGGGMESLRVALVSIGLVDEKTLVDRIAKKLKKNFSVEHAAGSSVMEITFTWDDPYIAQQIVKVWVDFYLEERSSVLSQSSTLYDFYNTARNDSALELEALQAQINSKLGELDTVDYKVRFDTLTMRLSDLREFKFEAINERASLKAGIQESSVLREQLPAEIITDREISLNPNKLDLNRQLNLLNIELIEKLRVFHETSEPILSLKKGISALEEKINNEDERQLRSENYVPNELITTLERDILFKKTKVKELDVLVKGYEQEMDNIAVKLQQLLAEKPVLLRLNAELAAAAKNYSLYLDNYEKARIDHELDKERISNIAVIEAASLNPSRVFPKSLNILLASLPLGFLVGLFVLYVCYLLDQRIHDGGRIESYFGVKLWTSLNEIGEKSSSTDSHFQASLYRIYSLLPLDSLAEKGVSIGLTSSRSHEGVHFISGHLRSLLEEQGITVTVDSSKPVQANQVNIIEAPALMNNSSALISLRQADFRVLVIEATATSVPTVEYSLSILETAFEKIDGIILNRKKFEIPLRVLRYLSPKVGKA